MARETPPRAWGRPSTRPSSKRASRNTPTGVGKTVWLRWQRPDKQKHPHGRGKDFGMTGPELCQAETPPRAWGRPGHQLGPLHLWRNTPTGVGKTQASLGQGSFQWKHPHGRGEDVPTPSFTPMMMETPPRAWGRLYVLRPSIDSDRNTPTGVGKTPPTMRASGLRRKHPHGRGEDIATSSGDFILSETPPRAWGRPAPRAPQSTAGRKHPHGRGEDLSSFLSR